MLVACHRFFATPQILSDRLTDGGTSCWSWLPSNNNGSTMTKLEISQKFDGYTEDCVHTYIYIYAKMPPRLSFDSKMLTRFSVTEPHKPMNRCCTSRPFHICTFACLVGHRWYRDATSLRRAMFLDDSITVCTMSWQRHAQYRRSWIGLVIVLALNLSGVPF